MTVICRMSEIRWKLLCQPRGFIPIHHKQSTNIQICYQYQYQNGWSQNV